MSDVKPSAAADRRPRIVGFLCDWAVSSEGLVREDGTMRDLPGVTLIKVPCSGFIRPSWLEFALKNGADGAFVCGCPLGDCFNRLGNNLIADRVVQMRRRLERQKIQPDRVGTIFHGLHEQAEFVAAVREFSDRVAKLPAPPPPAARKAAAAPATPAAAGAPAPGGPSRPGPTEGGAGETPPGAPPGQGGS
ncbi:MAG TPA: hydrogenase iron-sulfur subunit [bacterium]|nr:hydrogenase iron-sulfur subunit [bacterium]